MVLLAHVLPDGSKHFDWLIEPVASGPGSAAARASDDAVSENADEVCLLAFRISVRIDRPNVTRFDAQIMPPHRRHYLAYQGPVHGGSKGEVLRACGGMVRKVEVMGHENDGIIDAVSIRGKFTGGLEYTWAGVRENGNSGGMPGSKTTPNRRGENVIRVAQPIEPVAPDPREAWAGAWTFQRSAPMASQITNRGPGSILDDDSSSYGEWKMRNSWLPPGIGGLRF